MINGKRGAIGVDSTSGCTVGAASYGKGIANRVCIQDFQLKATLGATLTLWSTLMPTCSSSKTNL